MSRPGIRDVAVAADVAIGTVSNYLNHPERVSPEKSARIRAAIDSLGFVPSIAGRQLRLGVSTLLGYMVPDVSNPHFAEIAEGVEMHADARGVSVLIANSHRSREREDAYLHVFEQHQVRGLIVASHQPIEERLAQVRERGTPSVLVGQRARFATQPSVSIDDVSGGHQALQHLIDIGCRRIAFVGGPLTVPQIADRIAGASSAARTAAVSLEVIDMPDRTIPGGREVGRMIAERPPAERPHGVFAANDLLGLGILHELSAAGVDVPRELALVGFDDTQFGEASLIPLSSIRGRHEGFGEAIVDLLFDAIARGGKPVPDPHKVFAPDLVVRTSSAGFVRP